MSKDRNRYGRFIISLIALCMVSTVATAQSSSGKDTKIIFSPYVWGQALSGTSTIGMLPPLDIDASFGDLVSNLNFALSIHTEFVVNDWVFVIDPTYVALEIDIELPPPDAAAEMEVDIWLVEAWAGYQLNDSWEVIGGARYQSQDISVAGLPNPPFPDDIGVSESWTDWFIGARFSADLSDKWFLKMRGDVAVAGDSDTNWNVSIFVNRRFGDNKALNLGYRYMDNDYNDPGNYRWDVTQDGLVIGYTWIF